MYKEKRFKLTEYIIAFLIATIIFAGGLFVGYQINMNKVNAVDDLQEQLSLKTIGTDLQYTLLSEHPCESFNTSSVISEELFETGSKLDFLEGSLGKQNKKVLSLKEYYSLVELKHWLLMKKAKKSCSLDYDLVLYFYSNLGNCETCEQQGYVLSTIHKKYPGINIYSFDINIDNPALTAVKKIFSINSAPALILNDEVFQGFRDKEFIEDKLFNKKKD